MCDVGAVLLLVGLVAVGAVVGSPRAESVYSGYLMRGEPSLLVSDLAIN